jgi:hypothetical protein
MKRFLLFLALAAAVPAQTAALHQVYLLPMANGLDQYLANQITRGKIAQIVTDPKVADLIMTDRLGEGFEQKLAELRPSEEKKTAASDSVHNAFRSSAARGTLFLVDIKSRQVVWSDHEKPPAASDSSLNRDAARVAKKLQEAFSHP